ncbi:MAG: CHAD domain-containing protein [Candidatus Flexifilum sp.]
MPTATLTHTDMIEALSAARQPVSPEDTMAEAGRKVLLQQFIEMLKHEAGSRTGGDIEDVHDMRVATRRMRSTLQLLEPYFKPKAINGYRVQLRKIARALGAVRDLDVLIADIERYRETLDEAGRARLEATLALLNEERAEARAFLNRTLDKGDYRRFVDDFTTFLLTPGAGARPIDPHDVAPVQVRHALPTLIYSRLGQVRAYDTVLEDADETTLHSLRIEFKRLRYATTLFAEVLGESIKPFIEELKAAQDHLGRLQDIVTAETVIHLLADRLDDAQKEAAQGYLDALSVERETLRKTAKQMWKRFNARTVQRQLASAIAAL